MKTTTTRSAALLVALATLLPTACFVVPSPGRPLATKPTLRLRSSSPTLLPHHPQPHLSAASSSSSSLVTRHASSTPSDNDEENQPAERGPRTYITALAWLSFVTYAFTLAPGTNEAAKALDTELLNAIVANPFDPSINPLFVAIFNFLGVMPFVYSSLLLPGSRDQKPPAWPFLIGSFALGFFAAGPYLALRRFTPFRALPRNKFLAKAVENKIPAALALASSLYLVYYGLVGGDGGDLGSRVEGYMALFSSQTLPHVSSLDLVILSLFVGDSMREDMLRRDWYSSGKLLAFAGVPVVGPCLYLLLRPSLEIEEEEE